MEAHATTRPKTRGNRGAQGSWGKRKESANEVLERLRKKPAGRRGGTASEMSLRRYEERATLLHLLAMGASTHEQEIRMLEKFGIAAGRTQHLRQELEQELTQADRELHALTKQKQLSRLREWIASAAASGSWNAVASLERIVAQITGTLRPMEVNVNVGGAAVEAASAVLVGMGKDRLEHLLRTGEMPGSKPESKPAKLIETTAEPAQLTEGK